MDELRRLARRVRVAPGSTVDLDERAPDARLGIDDREQAEQATARAARRLGELGSMLAATGTRPLLVVLQGMDASGKDGTVRHCFKHLHPSVLRIASFKVPNEEERKHDFLWRIGRELPRAGQIGIFNRSHYEDVLVVRVEELVPREVWEARYEAINAWERHLVHEGMVIVKLFLHISREEQAERFSARIQDPTKNWKFDAGDLAKRERWDDYMEAYTAVLERTSTEWAPWHVIPGDRKWLRNYVVTAALVEALEPLGLEWPQVDPAVRTLRIT